MTIKKSKEKKISSCTFNQKKKNLYLRHKILYLWIRRFNKVGEILSSINRQYIFELDVLHLILFLVRDSIPPCCQDLEWGDDAGLFLLKGLAATSRSLCCSTRRSPTHGALCAVRCCVLTSSCASMHVCCLLLCNLSTPPTSLHSLSCTSFVDYCTRALRGW